MNWRPFTLSLMLTPLVVLTSSGSFAEEQRKPSREDERSVFIGEMKGEGKRFVQEIRGYFTSRQTQVTLQLKWLKRVTGLDTEESVEVLLDGTQVFYQEAFGVSFVGVCRSPSTGLDQVILHIWGGAPTQRGSIDFVYYDQNEKRFKYYYSPGDIAPVPEYYVKCSNGRELRRHAGSSTPCECTWEGSLKKELQGKDIFALLRPSGVETSVIVDTSLPTKSFSQAEFDQIRNQITNLNDQRFIVRDLAENKKWKIVAVYFEELWSSWGVLLAQDKRDETWKAFYNIPSGVSKVSLFMPKVSLGEGGLLKAKLCTDCTWWGVYDDFVIDLDTMRVK